MKWTMSIVGAAVLATCTAVGAQSDPSMHKGDKMDAMGKMDKMEKMDKMDVTYTGCLEAGSGGTFALTHAAAAGDRMSGKAMKSDSMKKDAMKGGSMAGDSMGKDSMKKDAMAKDTMMDTMAPTTLVLSSTSVDLKKHVGHKVSVTGSPTTAAMGKDTMMKDEAGLTVKSLKMVAASCS